MQVGFAALLYPTLADVLANFLVNKLGGFQGGTVVWKHRLLWRTSFVERKFIAMPEKVENVLRRVEDVTPEGKEFWPVDASCHSVL